LENTEILIVDDDKIILDSLGEFLSLEGYQAATAVSVSEARSKLQTKDFAVCLVDVNLSDGSGIDLLKDIRKHHPQTVTILITGYGTIESAVEAIKAGAYDYLTKPVIDDELLMAVERATNQQKLISENLNLRWQLENKYSLDSIISQDHKMSRIFELVEAVAQSSTTILMTGSSGTGKTMLARAIHNRSSRRNKPFIEVSCGALPENLLESELFGHVRGAFTGAVNSKEGKFLAADGGTIFLDEISAASKAMQVKLLRVLQSKTFEPVGSNKSITADTRVLLASNQDLGEKVRNGDFREDLYYRINVVTINLPDLRERISDVPLLAEYFLNHFSKLHNRSKESIDDEAMDILQKHSWPGNVRELENVIERAVLLSKESVIGVEDLPMNIVVSSVNGKGSSGRLTLKQALAEPEKMIIRSALKSCNWNRQETAKALGINRTTLYKKMKQYGLENTTRAKGL
jgi:DNA-binding NtrC family response regulator